MTNMSKNFKCNSCGTDFPLSMSTDLELSDFNMMCKCPKCGCNLQIHFGVIKSEPAPSQQVQPASTSNIDDSILVPPEMPSHEIKSLIDG